MDIMKICEIVFLHIYANVFRIFGARTLSMRRWACSADSMSTIAAMSGLSSRAGRTFTDFLFCSADAQGKQQDAIHGRNFIL